MARLTAAQKRAAEVAAAEEKARQEATPAEAEGADAAGEETAEGPVEKFPAHPKTLKGEALERSRIWARQEKANVVTLCRHQSKDGSLVCYYPASIVRDPSKDNNPMLKEDGMGRTYTVGRCSYAGDEHPEIRIYPPKKEDEIL